jgi:hypothetical protein
VRTFWWLKGDGKVVEDWEVWRRIGLRGNVVQSQELLRTRSR